MATAQDVKRVFEATSSCKTMAEIASITGLSAETVKECVDVLNEMGAVAHDDTGDRVCNFDAIKSLKGKFTKICELCK
jgi:hypothetical protein